MVIIFCFHLNTEGKYIVTSSCMGSRSVTLLMKSFQGAKNWLAETEVTQWVYSVKKCYQLLTNQSQSYTNFHWKVLWKLSLPPRILIFLWKLCHLVLPAANFLNHRNIRVQAVCPLCGQHQETVAHLFLDCCFVKVWFGSNLSIRLDVICPENIVNWIQCCLCTCTKYPYVKDYTKAPFNINSISM